MALLELAAIDELECTRVVVCLDRDIDAASQKSLMRDLGWVGFDFYTLSSWVGAESAISDRWIFMAVDM